MALSLKKLTLIAGVTGFGADQTVDVLSAEDMQRSPWEVVQHPDYETIQTVRHVYTGEYADPLEVYIIRDENGDPTGFRWTLNIIDIPEELRDFDAAWQCARNDSGLLELRNVFTQEVIDPMHMRLVQPVFSEKPYCMTDHEKYGFIGVHADSAIGKPAEPEA